PTRVRCHFTRPLFVLSLSSSSSYVVHRDLHSFPTRRSSDLVIAYYVHPVNIQTACLIMEGAEFTENIINGVERPVKAAELFAFTLRVRAGNTDVLTDAEENVRQKLRAEGVM